MTEYLPGSTGERITELREGAGLTIEELAAKIGVNATTLGRMENGRTQKIGDDVLAALAREFNVSTDFLLGLTSIPDSKNYDIAELGLSAQAARNLYTSQRRCGQPLTGTSLIRCADCYDRAVSG